MAITNISNAVRSLMCDAFVDRFDNDSANSAGAIGLYTASHAALLATVALADAPAFGAAANGVATANAIPEATATGTGTAAAGRFFDRGPTAFADCSVGAASSGEDIELNQVALATDDTISFTSGTITMPAS